MLVEQPFDAGTVVLNLAEGPAAGLPLILLHGGSGRWQSWETIMPSLIPSWHVLAPDLRGHGKSGWATGRYRLDDYADDIAALILRRAQQPAVLFGHSLGGIIALMVAARQPEHVRSVVVGDSPLTGETWRAQLLRDRAGLVAWRDLSGGRVALDAIVEALKNTPVVSSSNTPETVRMRDVWGEDSPTFGWVGQNLFQQDPSVLGMLLDDIERVVAGYEMERLLPAIRCPVLLLQGDPAAGGLMTDAEVARAMQLLPQPTHVLLAGVGHVLHNERKEPVLEALRPFLSSLL
jgi:pimeloyl-ACP methyl ester carboxylesterase